MILITGMPRSASSFLNVWFRDMGSQMTPKYYSTYMPVGTAVKEGLKFNLCEPIQLTKRLSREDMPKIEIEKEINLIYDNNIAKANNANQVVKCSPMSFFKNSFSMFDRVIITVRDLDSWCKSAVNHNGYNWFNKSRPKWLYNYYYQITNADDSGREFGKVWEDESFKCYQYCLNNKIPCDVYEYDSDESFKKLHLVYGLEPKGHSHYKTWIKRRF